jgi:subtilisin family serine protease
VLVLDSSPSPDYQGPSFRGIVKVMKGKRVSLRVSGILVCCLLLVSIFTPSAAQAETRLIVRDSLGLPGLNLTCLLSGCKVIGGLGDPDGQLFLVTFPSLLDPITGILRLNLQAGILSVELDQAVKTQPQAYAQSTPNYLTDEQPISYYGTSVWRGYVNQPANQLVRTNQTHSTFNALGAGVTVAVIDTGVDPTHPVLKAVLVSGYDFTRNTAGGSEKSDVNAYPDPNAGQTGEVNQRTVAVLDQRTVAVLDGSNYSAFGHGTMTAGLVHLVAPQAKIMPLKAFRADGTGYDSDVLRAIYYAVNNGARVLNMSFDYTTYSAELARAIKYANSKGVVSVASAGNQGQRAVVYPAALPGVIDVASTSNLDTQSSFTNYGAPPVWMAAPGEAVMTTYPWGTYAAGWGTSFSTPLVAGTAAMMLGTNGGCSSGHVPLGLSAADYIGDLDMGFGRLDTYQSLLACRVLH